jgi:hypothetical protein
VAPTPKSRLWHIALLWCALPAGAAPPQAPAAEDDPTLTRAKEIQAQHEADLFRVEGVKGVGLGKNEAGQWVVHVYATARTDRQAVPERLDGMEVVVFETEGFEAFDSCQVPPPGCPRPTNCAHRQPFAFPVPSGVSTSNSRVCTAGTIGFRACDAGNPGIVGYITNNHVAAMGSNGCANGSPPGTPQYQPGTCDWSCNLRADIGTLDRYITIHTEGSNLVDAAFVRSDAQRVSGNILDIGQPTANARDPMPGEAVRKSGSTTGLTQGTVQSINASVTVNYICFTAQFVGQIIVTPGAFSSGGDSGSPVVDGSNNPVGLLFAGSAVQTILNPITRVLDELGLSFNCSAGAVNNADFLGQSVPTEMNPGQQYPVWLTFRNIGTTTWTSAGLYRLGSQFPPNNTTWGLSRVELPHDVPPQTEVTFHFIVTAPMNPAIYDFRWRMVKDGVGEWFGEQSDNVRVTVGGGGPCPPTTTPQGLAPQGLVDDPTPTFSWTEVPGATTYTLYVQYPNGDVILRAADITTNSYVPADPLPVITNLIWKVKGECGVGSGPYSTHVSFRVLFGDVPANHWARFLIEDLYAPPKLVSENLGMDGLGRVVFGPENAMLRKYMARWLLKAKLGAAYAPPPAVGIFADVPPNSEFAPWIEDLFNRGITAGCGAGLYCPDSPVTREQAAVLLLRTKEGTAYQPPPCVTPTFSDVPCTSPFAPWVEEIHRRGITGGCAPGLYCPAAPVSRAESSVFVRATFY